MERYAFRHWRTVSDWLLGEIIFAAKHGISERDILKEAKKWEYEPRIVKKLLVRFEEDGDIIRVGENYWAKSAAKRRMVSADLSEWLKSYVMSRTKGAKEKDLFGTAKKFRFDRSDVLKELKIGVTKGDLDKKGDLYFWTGEIEIDPEEIKDWLRDVMAKRQGRRVPVFTMRDLRTMGRRKGWTAEAVEDAADDLILDDFIVVVKNGFSWNPKLIVARDIQDAVGFR